MATSLDNQLNQVRTRVRRVLWIHGLSWLIAVVFSVVLVVGIADWLIHLDDSGVRLILSLGILVTGGWVAWRFLLSPLMASMSNIDVALRIEKRYPGFKDSLASTVQFLHERRDARLGSPQMQQRVIDATLTDLDNVDLSDILDTREVVRIATAALCVCVVVAAIVGLNQLESATALNRLIFPFSESPWPRATMLRLVDSDLMPIEFDADEPLCIARGDTLEVFVENANGALPRDVVMEYRRANGRVTRESLRKTTLVDDQGQSREFAGVSQVVDGAMEFRAVGGDDNEMPWFKLEAIPPPEIVRMQVQLEPPAYSKRPPEELAAGVGHIRGLVGTQVRIDATVNKPLKSATLRLKDKPPLPLKVTGDGLVFRAEFQIAEPGVSSYWFAFTDQQGFENSVAARYEIRGIADRVPTVYFEQPSSDLQVTANADVPLRVVASDDLGLKSMQLRYRLADGPDSAGHAMVLFDGAGRPLELTRDYTWQLSQLDLHQGMRIVFHAEAADDCDLVPDHVGHSISRTLVVVSAEQKVDELAERQAELLDELDTIARTQKRSNEHVDELLLQLNKVGELRPQDIDMLKRVAMDQRQIASRMTNPADGVEARVSQLLEEFEQNGIQDDAAVRDLQNASVRRLQNLADESMFLRTDIIPAIEREMTRAIKSIHNSADSQQNDSDPSAPKKSTAQQTEALTKTGEHQSTLLESLDVMRNAMSKWRKHRDLTSDLKDVVAGQESVKQQTAEIGRETISRPFNRLRSQQQAELAKLRERQRKQAEELDHFRRRLDETARQLANENPVLADPLLDTADELDQRATSGRMRESANQIGQNQIGQATQSQQQILKDLNELGEILKKRGVDDAAELLHKLKQAESELETLKKRQAEILRKSEDAAELTSQAERESELQKLQKEQEQLRKDVSDMARRLRRLQARKSDTSARRAVRRMEQAENNLQKGNGEKANQQQREALDDLEQAERELAQTRKQAQERLAQEQLERAADELQGMIARQQNVINETKRIDIAHTLRVKTENRPADSWKRSETRSLRQLAEVQRGLKLETDSLAESMEGTEVFVLALRGAGRMMEKAASRLADRKPDTVTVELETAAKQRFVDLVAALRPDEPSSKGQQQRPQNGEQNAEPQRDAIPQLAQLKLLKAMQEDLNRRTAQLDAARDPKRPLTADDEQELQSLANEQKQLADLMRDLTRSFIEAAEADEE